MAVSQLSSISESFQKLQNPVEVPIPYETQISKKSAVALSERSCTVCLELKPIQQYEVYANTNCSHPTRTICDICMYEYVRNTWNIAIDVQCPECSASLPHVIVKQILIGNNDDALYERFAKLNLDRSLEQHPEFIWCAHGCGSGQLNEGGTMNMTVICTNCQKSTCFKHRSPWHEGMTCEEYDMPRNAGQQHASERWINGNTKACPKCHAHIEKNEGCDHMTCAKCKHEFCWQCLVSYAVKNSNIFEYISALFQGSEHYAIPPSGQEHWGRVTWNKMHIKRTSPSYVDITTDLYHNRCVHFYNEGHVTAAQVYGWDHIHVRIPKQKKGEHRTKFGRLNNSQTQTTMTSSSGAEKSLLINLLRGIPDFILSAGRFTETEHKIVKETTD
ncbi:unnamed protein product [Adineta ricciae]|uniref:RBR-type E3 ubiquitin transferase n=1 Tax=Adineta ricciae TaxID=249248 RepID=A0A815F9P4_ADIRI|nr:unnamed protein product [Adineta ricciae]